MISVMVGIVLFFTRFQLPALLQDTVDSIGGMVGPVSMLVTGMLLVTLLATATPAAATITLLAQVYGKDAEYASAIHVVTTLLCLVTIPIMVTLYQL